MTSSSVAALLLYLRSGGRHAGKKLFGGLVAEKKTVEGRIKKKSPSWRPKPSVLKIPSEKVQDFISWYEEAKGGVKTNPETGKERSYKGPWKRDLIAEIEYALENGSLSAEMVERSTSTSPPRTFPRASPRSRRSQL